MSIKRSEFLRLSAWGFVASLLPIEQVKALSFIANLDAYNQDNHALAVIKAVQAKEHFFKKEYALATTLYLECIGLAPADIRFYDNLQNVYGAQGLWLECVELFKNALIANPNKISFYDRAARSLMRLELGYPVFAQQYRNQTNSNSLLQDAKTLYNQALQISPDTEYLKIGKKKVKRKINSDAININYITNTEEKEKRITRRRKHKKRYKNLSDNELLLRIDRMNNRSRNTLYFENETKTQLKNIKKEKTLIYALLAKRRKQSNQLEEALVYANLVYEIDSENSKIVKLISRLYKKTNNYTGLLNFQTLHNQNMQTVYSALGLMNALSLKYRKEVNDTALLQAAIDVGEDLIYNWALASSLQVMVVDKLADIYILNNNVDLAKNIIRETIENFPIESEGLINNLIFDYAKSYFKANEYNEAKTIVLIGLRNYLQYDTEGFQYIIDLSNKKVDNTFEQNLRLYYLLYRIYKKSDDEEGKTSILQHIIENNPENRFVLKRLNN